MYPYLLARKPLLSVFHEDGPIVSLIREVGGAVCVTFSDQDSIEDTAKEIQAQWLQSGACSKTTRLNDRAFYPYTAKGSAEILCDFFNQILVSHQSNA